MRAEKGVKGPDVKQLEENLKALGYRGFTVDEEYSDAAPEPVVPRFQQPTAITTVAVARGPSGLVVAAGNHAGAVAVYRSAGPDHTFDLSSQPVTAVSRRPLGTGEHAA